MREDEELTSMCTCGAWLEGKGEHATDCPYFVGAPVVKVPEKNLTIAKDIN